MRYGQRFQAEKNNAQQSLFGGGGQVDIQRPGVAGVRRLDAAGRPLPRSAR